MTSSRKVLIAAPIHPVLSDGLTARGYTCIFHEQINQEAAFELIKDCVGIITSTRVQLDRPLIDAAPQLAWIGRMGSGMEVVDLQYAQQKGIACFSSPEGNCNAVAEHALGMLLALIRHIAISNEEVREGLWRREENRGSELEDKTLAIIGFGHTGSAFAKKLQGFDMQLMAFDKYNPGGIPEHIINCESLDPVFEQADIISFHVPLLADTIHYFNEDFMERMHKPFMLINTSRGVVVDTVALQQGLASGKVVGACLDVLEKEPISAMDGEMRSAMDKMTSFPNVILTPHIAGYTHEALYKMSAVLLRKIGGRF